MGRKALISGVVVAVALSALYLVLRRPSKKLPTKQEIEIADARGAACEAFANKECEIGCCQLLVVQLSVRGKEGPPTAKLNADDLAWDQMEERLSLVLKTRANRAVFFISDPAINRAYKSQMIDVVRTASAERICVVDAKEPPTWFPPQSCGGAGGGKLALIAP